jgi:uncharacterized repeat protein (TIGR03803 family)
VFKIDASGNETVLYNFGDNGDDGAGPTGLIRDAEGNLYGTTAGGGPWGSGVVFTLDPTGNTTTLYSFTGGADGASPNGGLVRDSAGKLYGTAAGGGQKAGGVFFGLTP